MKKISFLLLASLLAVACNRPVQTTEENAVAGQEKVMAIGDFMEIAIDSLEKEVKIKGTVSHVCSHSGRRCFIVDSAGNHSVRVEAKGNIQAFNRELSGMDIVVSGTVKEKRLYTDFLDEWEAKVKAKEKDIEDGGKHCSAELENIQSMRNWMAKNNKDYYSIIYLDGMDYDVVYDSLAN
ncbi:MAG: hypothetical protein MI975_17445 [Cytophagales bacterium]|nr:hypothetical protein [Cytophagales bacterium]